MSSSTIHGLRRAALDLRYIMTLAGPLPAVCNTTQSRARMTDFESMESRLPVLSAEAADMGGKSR